MKAPGTRFLDRVLWGAAAALLVSGAAMWLLPASSPEAAPAAPPTQSADSTIFAANPGVPDPSIAEEIAVASIFLHSRTPPSRRYRPPDVSLEPAGGGGGGGGGGSIMEGPMAMPPSMSDSLHLAGEIPRLFGTIVDSSGAKALLHLSGSSGPRLYTAGESDGGYRVISITPRAAVLSGPAGRITLRLDPPPEELHP
ncbi:MAG: hypothetical protein ACT4OZ_14610 [Gemmatimonadota bacterium]